MKYILSLDDDGNLILPEKSPVIASDKPFTPTTLSEYVGQAKAKALVKIMIEAAKAENRELPNILISGSYGQGKTSLAHLIYKEFGKEAKEQDGSSVNRLPPTNGRMIIDEAHNLAPEITDTLNVYLDRGGLHLTICTTNPGALSAPFRSRFRPIHLEPYTIADIAIIVKNAIHRKGYSSSAAFLDDIAKRSRFTPRIALNNLALIFDLMAVKREHRLTAKTLQEAFDNLGVDEVGFLERDRAYLSALPAERAVGLQYLSAVIGVDGTTIEEEIEPYLMRLGLIDRTARGRVRVVNI
jgi:Holliday junction DNA helicase RuvB